MLFRCNCRMSLTLMIEKWGVQFRHGLAVMLACFILVGPAYRQLLDGKNAMMPKWTMFSGMAVNFYALRLQYRQGDSGELQAVPSHLIYLSKTPVDVNGRPQPRQALQLRKKRDVDGVLRNVCRELGPETQLVMDLRWADRARGWKQVAMGEVRRCASFSQRTRTRGGAGR